jgi:capsule polysaccharide modification protein KpsS
LKKLDPLRHEDYKYTNEQSKHFTTFPTITAVMRLKLNLTILKQSPHVPEYGVHQLLHAEEKLYMIHPSIRIGAKYRQTVEVIDAIDKGKNAFFTLRHSAFTNNLQGA